jgi:hypothetical protein
MKMISSTVTSEYVCPAVEWVITAKATMMSSETYIILLSIFSNAETDFEAISIPYPKLP